jgi:hypothetical protein
VMPRPEQRGPSRVRIVLRSCLAKTWILSCHSCSLQLVSRLVITCGFHFREPIRVFFPTLTGDKPAMWAVSFGGSKSSRLTLGAVRSWSASPCLLSACR